MVKFVIRRSLHIDKIHKNSLFIYFLQFQLCHQNRIIVDIIVNFRSRRKAYSSEIPAHGIYRHLKRFFFPDNQIARNTHNVTMRSWNYFFNEGRKLCNSERCQLKTIRKRRFKTRSVVQLVISLFQVKSGYVL